GPRRRDRLRLAAVLRGVTIPGGSRLLDAAQTRRPVRRDLAQPAPGAAVGPYNGFREGAGERRLPPGPFDGGIGGIRGGDRRRLGLRTGNSRLLTACGFADFRREPIIP